MHPDMGDTSDCRTVTGTHELDLLLTDVVMPLMGGRELAEQVNVNHPETKVLLTSGYADEALLLPDGPETSIDFLQKPFTPPVLAQRVREVLDRR